MGTKIKTRMGLLLETWRLFRDRNGPLLSAAIAFYAALAVAPLGVIGLFFARLVFDTAETRKVLYEELRFALGPEATEFVSQTVTRSQATNSGFWATLATAIFVLFVTVRLFSMIRRALNQLWDTKPDKPDRQHRLYFLGRRIMAFVMVLIFGTLLIGLVAVRTLLGLASRAPAIEGIADNALMQFVIALSIVTVLSTTALRLLPDARIAWTEASFGAVLTSALITVTSFAISAYLSSAGLVSAYGAAGSLVVLLMWIYINTQIFFLGAAFTFVWAKYRERPVQALTFS